MEQTILTARDNYVELDGWLRENGIRSVFLVCDESLRFLSGISAKLQALEAGGLAISRFSDFRPNPAYASVVAGVAQFRHTAPDAILAIGGGSAMDVAKCIRLYAGMDGDGADGAFLQQQPAPGGTPFLAMPTTAGTGSEATRYAVIYYEGKKQSVTSTYCIPDAVLMDAGALKTLPLYQKKSTMLDALCHAVESFWSVNSTEESRAFSQEAIRGVLEHMDGYLAGEERGCAGMLRAANTAGKAINITQTTAGHAMCYKLTSLFGIAHGHAAALCDRALFPWMIRNTRRCIDARGEDYLRQILDRIGVALGGRDAREGAERFAQLVASLELAVPAADPDQFREVKTSVNPDRLKNHPVLLDETTIDALYHQILKEKEHES